MCRIVLLKSIGMPLLGWVKVNTKYKDTLRDFRGGVLGTFCSSYDIVAAEVMVVIKAIELAWVQDENTSS